MGTDVRCRPQPDPRLDAEVLRASGTAVGGLATGYALRRLGEWREADAAPGAPPRLLSVVRARGDSLAGRHRLPERAREAHALLGREIVAVRDDDACGMRDLGRLDAEPLPHLRERQREQLFVAHGRQP